MVDPLNATVPIVDAKGFPTLEFMRKWAQQNALNNTLAAGVAPASPGIASQFLAGTSPASWQYVKDSDIAFTDILNNNVSTSKHGFAPKGSGSALQFLNGIGTYTVPTDAIATLTDVQLTSLSANQYLQWNGTKWVNVTLTASSSIATLTDVQLTSLADTQILQYDAASGKWKNVNIPGGSITRDITFVIDGGGVAILAGMKGYLSVDFACTIQQVTMLADQSGSAVVNIYKCTYAQFDAGTTHPVAADKITAAAPPTISTATKAQDATLTGWTTAISAGDILAFNVDSATTVQRLTVTLKVLG